MSGDVNQAIERNVKREVIANGYYQDENQRHFRKSRMSLKLVKQDANQDGVSVRLCNACCCCALRGLTVLRRNFNSEQTNGSSKIFSKKKKLKKIPKDQKEEVSWQRFNKRRLEAARYQNTKHGLAL